MRTQLSCDRGFGNVEGVLGMHSPSLESWVCRPGEEGGGAEMTDPHGSQCGRGIGYTLTDP